jgi:hypothetical protein
MLNEIIIERRVEPEGYVRPSTRFIQKLRAKLEQSECLRGTTISEGASSTGKRIACVTIIVGGIATPIRAGKLIG